MCEPTRPRLVTVIEREISPPGSQTQSLVRLKLTRISSGVLGVKGQRTGNEVLVLGPDLGPALNNCSCSCNCILSSIALISHWLASAVLNCHSDPVQNVVLCSKEGKSYNEGNLWLELLLRCS